jgi:hypothetical protein
MSAVTQKSDFVSEEGETKIAPEFDAQHKFYVFRILITALRIYASRPFIYLSLGLAYSLPVFFTIVVFPPFEFSRGVPAVVGPNFIILNIVEPSNGRHASGHHCLSCPQRCTWQKDVTFSYLVGRGKAGDQGARSCSFGSNCSRPWIVASSNTGMDCRGICLGSHSSQGS